MKKRSIKQVLLGADPEVFLKNVINGEIVSAEGLIGGTKEQPLAITKKGHNVQEDNVMAEFCIPPASNQDDFFHSINFMINYLRANTPTELDVAILPSARLDKKYLKSKQALTFGCDPDFNAHTYSINESPDSKSDLRTAGGHIHVGYQSPDEETSVQIIRNMDLYLGLPSIIMDSDSERRKMYGKAGAFRMKAYGVEYRTLSNFWLKDEEHIKWAYNNTLLAVKDTFNGKYLDDKLADDVVDAINNNDVASAAEIIGAMNIPFINVEPVTVKEKAVAKELVKA